MTQAIRFPLMVMPNAIAAASEGIVALQRIEAFIHRPEAPPTALQRKQASARQTDAVELAGAVFRWGRPQAQGESSYRSSLQTAARVLASRLRVLVLDSW